MHDIGVANVQRSPNGERYTITRNADNGIVGYVEITNGVKNVRGYHDEPITVGSPTYKQMVAAVKRYQSWAESIQTAYATAVRRTLEIARQ